MICFKALLSRAALLMFAVFALSCGPLEPQKPWAMVSGKVIEVRVTADTEFESTSDPVGGAIVGGLIGGTTGAIIGTAMTSDGQINLQSKLRGCRVVVQMKDGTQIAFTFIQYPSEVTRCSLMRPGDHARLKMSPDIFPTYRLLGLEWESQGEVIPSDE